MKQNYFSFKYILAATVTILVIIGLTALTAIQSPVPKDETGLLIRSGKLKRTYHSGEKVFALPLLDTYLTIPAVAKSLHLTGPDAILLRTPDNGEILIEANLTYTINNLPFFIRQYGVQKPIPALKNKIREELSKKILTLLEGDISIINNTRSRIMLIAGLHSEMNDFFLPAGVLLNNFELSVK
jgi:hypothetical protein